MKTLPLLLLAISLGLFSCGNHSNTPPPETDNTTTEQTKDSTAPTPQPAATEITFVQFEEPNMFTVEHPEAFANKTEKKHDNDDPYAGALSYWFASPDEDITFFIFPLYPSMEKSFEGITLNEETEFIKNKKVSTKDKDQIEEVLIEAKDGSYTRKYIKNEYSYVGMIYKNAEVATKYQAAFDKFRTSATNLTDG
ncbi:MAG: hypothetical protein GY810_09765 [Aureispira sp.]|nr:hypothetical protein [Aureispira sp.]